MTSKTLGLRLAETIAWTQHLLTLDPTNASMRSPETRPQILHSGYDDVVCDLGTTRQFRLRELGIECSPAKHLNNGRLLCFYQNANLTDGAAEPETNGFFDICNNPPWDTWVGHFIDDQRDLNYGAYVLCFVTQELIELVDRGIMVNPEECIQWLDESDASIQQHLIGMSNRNAG